MHLYVKLAWRNVLRNKRRSVIASAAIGLGLAALMVTDALMRGMEISMLSSATGSFLGEGQIHNADFRESFAVEKTIVGPDAVLAALADDSAVAHFAPRVMSMAMISSPANVSMINMVGVDPAAERFLSDVDDDLIAGDYFGSDDPGNLLIGQRLAELLEVELGDRVVITTARAHSGELAQELFRVSGIFHVPSRDMDRGLASVHLGRAQAMLGLEGQLHEIALTFRDIRYGSRSDLPFWKRYGTGGNEAVGWPVLLPQLAASFELLDVQTWLVGLILFAIVALGIMNTLFMSLYERMFEFGVLRAVGTRPLALGRLVLFEAGALGVIGIAIGALLGLATNLILSATGIDYSGIEFAGATMRDVMYPVFDLWQFTFFPAAVLLITVVVGLYPAAYAARLTPAVAMRRAM